MKFTHLTTLEVQDLVNRYYSELRKLEFQVENITSTIQGLEQQLKTSPEDGVIKSTTEITAPKKRGRKPGRKNGSANENGIKSKKEKVSAKSNGSLNGNPSEAISKKVAAKSEPKAKRGRKPGRKKGSKRKTGGYKLSEFDTFIIQSLQNSGHVLVNSDFLSMAAKSDLNKDLKMNEDQLKAKLNRSLFKMANRRDELVKIDYPGKGFAYALSKWTDEYGNLKNRYTRDFETV